MRGLWTLLLAGCVTGALDFDLEKPIPENTVSGDAFSCTLNEFLERATLQPFALDIDIENETGARDTGPARRVELKSTELAITPTKLSSGDEDNFDFLQSLAIAVESTKSGSALGKVEIARLDPVPRGQTSIALVPAAGVDLLPYVNEGAKITSSAKASLPCDDTSFNGKVVVRVMF